MWSSQHHQESRLHRPNTHRAPVRRRHRFRPRLEGLEERTVLSTLTVLNTLDKGAGSLRNTITGAMSGDTIVFAPSLDGQTITLTSDQLEIKTSLDIEGPGAGLLAISGNDANGMFKVKGGSTVTIAGLTLTHGRVAGAKGGGAILNAGTLTVSNDVLSFNQAENLGGAIYDLPGGVLTTTGSTFLNNQVIGQDGAFLTEGGAISGPNDDNAIGPVTVIGCTFIGNRAVGGDGGVLHPNAQNVELGDANGGAIHTHTSLTIIDSIFIGNQAIAGSGANVGKATGPYVLDLGAGGAIAHDAGTLFVSGCAFSDNQAIGGSYATGISGQGRIGHAVGGAIQCEGLEATITNSAFDHNEALGGSNNTGGSGALIVGRAAGGAIDNLFFSPPTPTLTVGNCTFTDNQAVGGTNNVGAAFVSDGIGGALLNERGAIATVTGSRFIGNLAVGGQRGDGNGADGLGGGIANFLGSALTINTCTLTGNQAIGGGADGAGGNGGNGFGGGIFNDGLSIWPTNVGTPATLIVLGSTISGNQVTGGSAGPGGSDGQGIGGGAYFAAFGVVCLDTTTIIKKNHASTSNDNIFGVFTTC